MKKLYKVLLGVIVGLSLVLTGCDSKADVVSRNISREADQFKIYRRIVFYNGFTGDYILVVEGYCSLGNFDEERELSVTCKVGEGKYVKHFLGLSATVTYFAEQLREANVSPYHYKVYFRPTTIVPNVEMDTP